MSDQEEIGGVLFLALFILLIVIIVLGGSVRSRLKKDGISTRSPKTFSPHPLVGLIFVALLFVVAFLSTFLPYLALIPAVAYCVRGAQALPGGDRLDRDGGIVLILGGVAWALFTWLQASLLAWSQTVMGAIRIDLVLTLPAMILVAAVGWGLHGLLRNRARAFYYDGRTKLPR